MIPEVEIGLFFGLALAMVGCYKYVHDKASALYKAQAKFMQGWNEWRMTVVTRLTTIETILEERKDES